MSRTAWRIGADTPSYTADDLSGNGARITGGRWNPKGAPVVYTSLAISLACLETIVHLGGGGLPLNRYLVRIDIPDAVWKKAETLTLADLPIGWDAEPPGKVSIGIGAQWLASSRSPLLIVPSVIAPEENNLLINPRHPDAAAVTAAKVRPWRFDGRLTR